MAASSTTRLAAACLLLALGAALASQAAAESQLRDALWWPYRVCPGGEFARTPDKCASCTCGYRPSAGGGDCRQYPDNFCACYQYYDLTCDSMVKVDQFDGTQTVKVDMRLGDTCDAGFTCRDNADGPYCCPTDRVRKPNKRWEGFNSRRVPGYCSNTEDPAYCKDSRPFA